MKAIAVAKNRVSDVVADRRESSSRNYWNTDGGDVSDKDGIQRGNPVVEEHRFGRAGDGQRQKLPESTVSRLAVSDANSHQTTFHDDVRNAIEGHGGRPTPFEHTSDSDGLLHIDSDEADDDHEPISWAEFFEEFEENELALVCQDEGEDVRFAELVSRET